jgi:hypothetical protein
METFQGAHVRERGVEFAIVVVKSHVLNSDSSRREAAQAFGRLFGRIPIVLMAQDGFGTPQYWGRPDIVNYLSQVPMEAIPWKRFTVS